MARGVRLHGKKRINSMVSHMPEVKAAVVSETEAIAMRAEMLLSSHRQTGNAKIETGFGKTDGRVSLVDEAALSIEFGHWNARTGRYTEGLYILTRAAGFM